MKLQPIDDHVVIEVKELMEKNVGGIIIPDTAKEKPQMGEVMGVGTDEDLQKVLKEGDKVLYSKYSGTEVDVEGKKYIILSRSDILAKIV
jgi:chaperonin GroES